MEKAYSIEVNDLLLNLNSDNVELKLSLMELIRDYTKYLAFCSFNYSLEGANNMVLISDKSYLEFFSLEYKEGKEERESYISVTLKSHDWEVLRIKY